MRRGRYCVPGILREQRSDFPEYLIVDNILYQLVALSLRPDLLPVGHSPDEAEGPKGLKAGATEIQPGDRPLIIV